MNFQRLTSIFRSSTTKKKQATEEIDKWYEYSSMNDIYNPTISRIKQLNAKGKKKKKIGSA